MPARLANIARAGAVGFHPTMLPRGRGRAPVAWTILLGELAAVNLFFLTDDPDAGDIIAQREVPVLPDDYSEDLIRRTNEVLTEVVLKLAPLIKAGALPRTPQDHSQATYYPKRGPEDGLIDWTQTTDEIYRLVRAAGRPYPGAFCFLGSKELTVWRATPDSSGKPEDGATRVEPGTIISVDAAGRVLIRTGDGGMWLTEVEFEDGENLAADLETGVRLRSSPTDGEDA